MPKKAVDGFGNDVIVVTPEEVTYITDGVVSVPPDGEKKKVTNIYVEIVDGQPKLRVEYEE
jgi:hypothetical protein